MAKSKSDELSNIDEKIEQLKNRKKVLLQSSQKQERKDRNRRLILLGSRVEASYKAMGVSFKDSGNSISQEYQDDVYRYIQIGMTLEKVLGKKLTNESISYFEQFIKFQEERGSFVTKALFFDKRKGTD